MCDWSARTCKCKINSLFARLFPGLACSLLGSPLVAWKHWGRLTVRRRIQEVMPAETSPGKIPPVRHPPEQTPFVFQTVVFEQIKRMHIMLLIYLHRSQWYTSVNWWPRPPEDPDAVVKAEHWLSSLAVFGSDQTNHNKREHEPESDSTGITTQVWKHSACQYISFFSAVA